MFRPNRKEFMLTTMLSLQLPFPSSRCRTRRDLSCNITIALHFSPFPKKSATTRNSRKFHSCETHKGSRLCWEAIGTKAPSPCKLHQICFKHIQSWQHTYSQPLFQPMNQELLLTLYLLAILASWGHVTSFLLFFLILFVDLCCLNFFCNTYTSRIVIT